MRTMPAMFLCSALVFALPAGAADPPRPKADSALEAELTVMEKQSWDAWQKRDGAFFSNFLSDDHVEVGDQGIAGKKAVVGVVGSPVCVVKSYDVDSFSLTVIDADTALLNYHARQDTLCNGQPVPSPAWVSSLYVRRGGRWLNVLYQQTWSRTVAK